MAKGGQTTPAPGSAEIRAAWARREAERILAGNPSPEDRAEAEALLRRTSTPPKLYGFALLAAAIFFVLLVLALSRYA